MKTKIIEATNGPQNHGKFLLGWFEPHEWERPGLIEGVGSLIWARGWTPKHVLVLDLQTGEAAMFHPGGSTSHDLEKHAVWVCPLYEPFLKWLYAQDLADPNKLPDTVDLPDAEFRMYGHRRPGPAAKVGQKIDAHARSLILAKFRGTEFSAREFGKWRKEEVRDRAWEVNHELLRMRRDGLVTKISGKGGGTTVYRA